MAFNTNGAATAGPKGLFSIDPLDVRLQVKTKAALADIKAGTVYESIHVFCQEDKKFYTPKNYSTTDADANVVWEEVKSDSAWGQISGTLSDQIDLNTALSSKVDHYDIMPAASADLLGKVVQYVGEDDSQAGLTKGYFYICISDGQEPATYFWDSVYKQGVNILPVQTGQNGKFLTTNGTNASWDTPKPIVWVTYEDAEDSGE